MRICGGFAAAIGVAMVLGAAAATAPERALGQETERAEPETAQVPEAARYRSSSTRQTIVMQQLGYPGMFSTRLLLPIGGLHMFGPGVTFLPELTGVGVEYRYQFNRPQVERFGFHLGVGSTYYYITEDGRSTSAVGAHGYFGTMYRMRSNFALGADLGYIGTSGTEDGIRSFKIEKGLASTYINFSIALYF